VIQTEKRAGGFRPSQPSPSYSYSSYSSYSSAHDFVLPLVFDLIQTLPFFVEGLGLLPSHPTHQGEIADPTCG